MRILTKRTVNTYAKRYPKAKRSLLDWYRLAEAANWPTPNALKASLGKASIVTTERVVFNIHGNDYRLIVAIDYVRQWLFVLWFGTHADYDTINAATVTFEEPS